MTRNKLLIHITLAALVTTMSCTKDFKEINTNPALVTTDQIDPGLVLASVEKNAVFSTLNSHGRIIEYAGYYKNPASGNIFLNTDHTFPFNSFYRSYLINTQEIIRLTSGVANRVNENAIARILRVWLYHIVTDAYGDIPYFEALQDVNDMILQPKYDTQEAVYKDLFKELKEAAAQFVNSADQLSFGNADLLLKGDNERWIRFANSLRLRLAMRVRYADATLAQQQIAEVLSQPLIETNAQNVKLNTADDGNTANSNQFYQRSLTSPNNMVVSFTLTDNLKKLNDPRLPVLARPAAIAEAGYRGVPPQIAGDQRERYANDSVAHMALSFLQPIYEQVLISAAEVKLLRAEAALAGLTAEDEQALFEEGIQLAMEQYKVPGGDITGYLASPSALLSGSDEEKLEQIIVQKWLATYYNSHEGWAEFRRTGYPRMWTGAELGDTNGNIPRRLTYPVDEFFRNKDNVTEAANRIDGGDKLMGRIWWDKKAGLPFAHPRQGMFPPEQ
ncbi:MAG: SusD/RagB family nutrient-binding outer membrane lipoprotein [Chitinophagaceae bacterium]|nr:SusD/RagB family nutrient-binding outer membrane lipoprotein [Chitinophagaceae bacterium]